jgi:hypothetical protein
MPRLSTESFGAGDQSWLGGTHGIYNCRTVAPDPELFTSALYPDGVVPSGTPLGVVTATGKVGPYAGDTSDEVQTLTEGGSGLTSFTITFDGETTVSIDDDATAATVQAALEDLDSVGAGNVTVTGGPLASGAFTVTFGGDLANENVPAMTTTPTGGTGTVVVATTTAGGADVGSSGAEVLAGFLYTDQKLPAEGGWPLLDHGRIKVDRLPVPNFLKTGHNTTGLFTFIEQGD